MKNVKTVAELNTKVAKSVDFSIKSINISTTDDYELISNPCIDSKAQVRLSGLSTSIKVQYDDGFIEYLGFEYNGNRYSQPVTCEKDLLNNKMIYNDIIPGISMEAQITEGKVKINYVLNSWKSSVIFSNIKIPYNISNLSLEQSGDDIYINHATYGRVMIIGNLIAIDSNGSSIKVSAKFDNNYIWLSVDRMWMAQAKYPITIDPTTVFMSGLAETNTINWSQPRDGVVRFSDNTILMTYAVDGVTSYFKSSPDGGTTWNNCTFDGAATLTLRSLSIAVYNDILYVIGLSSTEINSYGTLRLYKFSTTNKIAFTNGLAAANMTPTTSGNVSYPILMKPYVESDGKVRLPIGYALFNTNFYANFIVIRDDGTTMTQVVSVTGTTGPLHRDSCIGFGMDNVGNVHTTVLNDTSYWGYARIAKTGVDTFGSWSAVTQIWDSSGPNTGYCTLGSIISTGPFANHFMGLCGNYYFIVDQNGTLKTKASVNGGIIGFGDRGYMTSDEYGNIYRIGLTSSSGTGYNEFKIDIYDSLNRSWRVVGNLFTASGGNTVKLRIPWGGYIGGGKLLLFAVEGTTIISSYAMNVSQFPAVNNIVFLPSYDVYSHQHAIKYFSNGDAFISYIDTTITDVTQKYRIVVTKDRGRTWILPVNGILPSVPSTLKGKIQATIDEDNYIHVMINLNPDTSVTNTDSLYYWRGSISADRATITWITSAFVAYTSPAGYSSDFSWLHQQVFAHKEGTGWMFHAFIEEEQTNNIVSATQYCKQIKLSIASTNTITKSSVTIKSYTDTNGSVLLDQVLFDRTPKKFYFNLNGGSAPSVLGVDPNRCIGTYSAGSWTWTTGGTETETVHDKSIRFSSTSKRYKNSSQTIYYNGTQDGTGYASTTAPGGIITLSNGISMILESDRYLHVFWVNRDATTGDLYYSQFDTQLATWGAYRLLLSNIETTPRWFIGKVFPTTASPVSPYSLVSYGKVGSDTYYIVESSSNTIPNTPTYSNITSSGYTVNKRPKLFLTVSDPDTNQKINNVEIQISTDNTFATTNIDSQFANDSGYGTQIAGWSGLPTTTNAATTITWIPQSDLPIATLYIRSRIKDDQNTWSNWSSTQQFIISSEPWSDTLTPSLYGFKAVWMNDLVSVINAARQFRGLPTATFIDGTITAQSTDVKSTHITERRTKLNDVLVIVGITPTWTDTTPVDKNTQHIIELRNYCKQI